MRKTIRILFSFLMLLLLCACGAQVEPLISLQDAEVTTADLFHEDGVYLFLPHDSTNEEFIQIIGVDKDSLDLDIERRFRQERPANPLRLFQFEGVSVMAAYGEDGFTIVADVADTQAMEIVMASLEEKLGEEVAFEETGYVMRRGNGHGINSVKMPYNRTAKISAERLAEEMLEAQTERKQVNTVAWATEWNGWNVYLSGLRWYGGDEVYFQSLTVWAAD